MAEPRGNRNAMCGYRFPKEAYHDRKSTMLATCDGER
jgi:hypothetical protein